MDKKSRVDRKEKEENKLRRKIDKNLRGDLIESLMEKLENLSLKEKEEIELNEIAESVQMLLRLKISEKGITAILKKAEEEWEKINKKIFPWDLLKYCRLE